VLYTVLGANLPLDVIDHFVRKIWAQYEVDKTCFVKSGLFLVRFKKTEDQLEVLQKGVFYFARKPFMVKPWNPEMEINTADIQSLPIWVQMPGLDIKY